MPRDVRTAARGRMNPTATIILTAIITVSVCGMYIPQLVRLLWSHSPKQDVSSTVNTTMSFGKSYFELFRIGLQIPELQNESDFTNAQQQIRQAMKHAWLGYEKYAWGADILHPLSKTKSNWISEGMGVTLIDSLDTLLLMSLTQEYNKGLRWVTERVLKIKNGFVYSGFISVFETVIRVVGGLLSAFCLSGDSALLIHAEQITVMLLPAFRIGELPKTYINPSNGQTRTYENGKFSRISVADVGSIQLEFRLLSWLTGNTTYDKICTSSFDTLLLFLSKQQKLDRFLAPQFISQKGMLLASTSYSVGGNTDSFYEYLLKQYLLSNKSEDFEVYVTKFKIAVKSIRKHLVGNSNGVYYFGKLQNGELRPTMDHLSCFMPGLLILTIIELGDDPSPDPSLGWGGRSGGLFQLANKTLQTCVDTYKTPTGLSPENVIFNHGSILPGNQQSLLRPETVESLFYMYRYTGDESYREMSIQIFNSIVSCCRTPDGGFSSLASVLSKDSKRDEMESFFTAETLKYIFLTSSESTFIPLKDFVFNTEGHPFPKEREVLSLVISKVSRDDSLMLTTLTGIIVLHMDTILSLVKERRYLDTQIQILKRQRKDLAIEIANNSENGNSLVANRLAKTLEETTTQEEEYTGCVSILREEEETISCTGSNELNTLGKVLISEAIPILEILQKIEDLDFTIRRRSSDKKCFISLPSFKEWCSQQSKSVETARETLINLRNELITSINKLIIPGTPKNIDPSWVHLISSIEDRFCGSLIQCLRNNVFFISSSLEVLNSQIEVGSSASMPILFKDGITSSLLEDKTLLFCIQLKLNQGGRLNYTPAVVDIPEGIKRLLSEFVNMISSVSRLNPSIDKPCDPSQLPEGSKTILKKIIPTTKSIVTDVDIANQKIKNSSEGFLEFLCCVEDSYSPIWNGETVTWSRSETQQMVSELVKNTHIEDLNIVCGVYVDTTTLRKGLAGALQDQLSGPKSNDLSELLMDDISTPDNEQYPAVYSPPKEGFVHVNPMLNNPPRELEEKWALERQAIQSEHQENENNILSRLLNSDVDIEWGIDSQQQQQQQQQEEEEQSHPHPHRETKEKIIPQQSQPQPQPPPQPATITSRPTAEPEISDSSRHRIHEEEARIAAEREAEHRRAAIIQRQKDEQLFKEAQLQSERQAEERCKKRAEEETAKQLKEVHQQNKKDEKVLIQKRVEQTARHHDAKPPTPPDAHAPRPMTPGTSLEVVYRRYCKELSIKPNSGVLKMLPKEVGVHVRELNLGLNYIGVRGVQPLLEVLRRNSGLRVLNLQDNNLENGEIRSLVNLLTNEPGNSLTTLNLSTNPISLAGGSALLELTSKQQKITSLNLEGTLIQPKIIERINEQLAVNKKVTAAG